MKLYIVLLFIIIGIATAQHYGSRSSGLSSNGRMSVGPQHSSGSHSSGISRGQSSGSLSGMTRGHSSGGASNHGGHRGRRNPQHRPNYVSSGHLGSVSGSRVLPVDHSGAKVASGGQFGAKQVSGGHSSPRRNSGSHAGAGVLPAGQLSGISSSHRGGIFSNQGIPKIHG